MLRQHAPDGGARPYAVLLIVGLFVVAWVGVYVAGGTRTAMPHLFYLPVVASAAVLGRRGGIVAGFAATVLCGPAMPLNVAAGVAQSTGNWLTRGAFFIVIGAVTGTAVRAVATGLERDLTRRFRRELTGPPAATHGSRTTQQIRAVLDGNQFTCVFQPIYDLDDGHVVAVEALTRFHDALPSQTPDLWFAQAAQAGLGVELELATVQAALETTSQLPGSVALSLNASPELLADPRLVELVDRHPGRSLIVEVTEHAVIEDYASLQAALTQLRQRGVRVAVDDAGAGFASLRHIVRLAPDIIKIDISLTQHVRDDPVLRALAAALVQFADQTGTELVAEGIETTADLAAWQDLGAHAAQGYLLARPSPLPLSLDGCPHVAQRPTRRHTFRPTLVDVSR